MKLGFSFLAVLLFALPFQIVSRWVASSSTGIVADRAALRCSPPARCLLHCACSIYDHSSKTFPAVWTMISLVAAMTCVAIGGCMTMRFLWKRSRNRQFGDAYQWRSRQAAAANILPGARLRLLPR